MFLKVQQLFPLPCVRKLCRMGLVIHRSKTQLNVRFGLKSSLTRETR